MTSPLHTTLGDGGSPSFFELHMAERIQRSLSPAFQHIIRGLAANATDGRQV